MALSSLKRTCRSARLHDKWKLTLTDNLSCLAAFERGRATSFALNQLCRTAAAYAMSCGVSGGFATWRPRGIQLTRTVALTISDSMVSLQNTTETFPLTGENCRACLSTQSPRGTLCRALLPQCGALPPQYPVGGEPRRHQRRRALAKLKCSQRPSVLLQNWEVGKGIIAEHRSMLNHSCWATRPHLPLRVVLEPPLGQAGCSWRFFLGVDD